MYLTESPVVFRMILASHFGLRTAPPWNLWLNWAWYDSGYTKNHAVPTMMMCRSKKPQLISTTITVIILFLTTFWLVLRLCVKVINVGSDTFGNPIFQRGLKKLAIFPDYRHPGLICLALPACRKVRKMDFQSQFSMSKIIRIFLNFFFHWRIQI